MDFGQFVPLISVIFGILLIKPSIMPFRFKIFAVFSFILLSFCAFAQSKVGYDPLNKPNTFQHPDNPLYWKNKMPHPNYWQQDVYYNIKADVDERTDIITGSLQLTYWNNSPDTLTYVFFHLYQNAFQPCSYYDNLNEHNHVKPTFGHYEAEGLGTTVENLTSNGKPLKTETDNTIMKVYLDKPLLPGAAMDFSLDFKTYFDIGSMRRRMKYYMVDGKYKHYNGVHWYPRISVYDAKFGWTTDQHLGREFYADFGTYDLELTFASNYIVEATGNLLNREEVMPDSLREKLDIKNFAKKPWGEPASEIIPYDSTQRKTWKFHAENVHNVAFTADPTYRIGEAEWNGIKCIALVEEGHAAGWQKVAQYTADVVALYSTDFGMYGYPKMIVADARDGMEYPMLTLCGGSFPSNKGLIAHEVGHNWFYGMVGNNETYRAALDEGFTQFLTVWALETLDGPEVAMGKMKKYKAKFKKPDLIRNLRAYDSYIWDAINEADAQLNTHSDGFSGALGQGGGYRHVYSKTAVMLYNLQYVLGDTLFQNAMKNYFHEYSYAHPYFEDLRNSFIHYTHVDLNWFFDQWLETTKNIDYAVGKVKHKGQTTDGKQEYEITFKREGLMQMPIDFIVITAEGDTSKYYIPNTWFEKETDATVLPRWIGWDNNLKPEHTVTVAVSGKIKDVQIDPTYRLADVNMLNNSKKMPIELSFDHKIYNRARWTEYSVKLRPALWWNAYDGLKLGLHYNSGYIAGRHKVAFSVLAPTGNLLQGSPSRFNFPEADKKGYDKFNYYFSYETRLDKYVKNLSAFYYSEYWDRLELYKFGVSQGIRKNSTITLYAKLFARPYDTKLNHLLYPGEWQSGQWNTSFNLEWDHKYRYAKGTGSINATLRSSALFSDYDYHYLTATAINHTKLWRFELHSRAFMRIGTGSNQAPESALFLAGANPEELMDQPLVRSIGYVPPTWVGSYGAGTNHFQQGGGLNLRGYAGYYVVEENGGQTYKAYNGQSGGAINLELDFDGLVKWNPKKLSKYFKLDTYLFGDAGMIVYDASGDKVISNLRLDAGAGLALTIKKFGPLETVKPLTLRFDVPFYLSHAPFDEENVQFRFVIGVSRVF